MTQCPKCSHEWGYTGKARFITCPTCRSIFKNDQWKDSEETVKPICARCKRKSIYFRKDGSYTCTVCGYDSKATQEGVTIQEVQEVETSMTGDEIKTLTEKKELLEEINGLEHHHNKYLENLEEEIKALIEKRDLLLEIERLEG